MDPNGTIADYMRKVYSSSHKGEGTSHTEEKVKRVKKRKKRKKHHKLPTLPSSETEEKERWYVSMHEQTLSVYKLLTSFTAHSKI